MTSEEFKNEWFSDNKTMLLHTSGSTGTPKQIDVEKQRMAQSALLTCDFLGLKSGDTALLCMSLDYIGGKMMVVRSIIRQLQLIEVPPSNHPLAQVNQAITLAAMVPMQVFHALSVPEERAKLMQIKHLLIGGGAINDTLYNELKTFPNAVWSTYGMTETLSHIALRRLNGSEASQWYTVLPGISIAVDNRECLEINAPALCKDILSTNDIAELRHNTAPDNCQPQQFRILGRIDNTINTGGIKVQIETIEQQLHNHLPYPFMITKRKDPLFGEAIVLIVEIKEWNKNLHTAYYLHEDATLPAEKTLFAQIKECCKKVLHRYHVPRYFMITKQLPFTENGKPNRTLAMKMAE